MLTLTKRYELVLDRWNAMPLKRRNEFTARINAIGLRLADMAQAHSEAGRIIRELEEKLPSSTGRPRVSPKS